jgi:hypothetical protein
MNKSDEVSNEQLLEDIENTRKEAEAYEMMAKGERILCTLPENAGDRFHHNRAIVLEQNNIDCLRFLQQLETLKKERGL